MLKYAKIINEETKACDVGTGTNIGFYQSIGMTEQDVEQAWNGSWYLTGYAPEKPIEVKQGEVRAIRNRYLEATDKYMLPDYPLPVGMKEEYIEYRQYLRDFTEAELWWEYEVAPFEEWKQVIIDSSDEEDNV